MMNTLRMSCLLMAGAASLAGCAVSTTPQVDSRFGESMTLIRAQQTMRPEASRNTSPVAGIDGKAAKGALDNYRESFRRPPAEPPTLNVGGFGGGGN